MSQLILKSTNRFDSGWHIERDSSYYRHAGIYEYSSRLFFFHFTPHFVDNGRLLDIRSKKGSAEIFTAKTNSLKISFQILTQSHWIYTYIHTHWYTQVILDTHIYFQRKIGVEKSYFASYTSLLLLLLLLARFHYRVLDLSPLTQFCLTLILVFI